MFVAEDPMDISTPKASATEGRIICIHLDGHRTIFAEKLYAVFGMQYLDGKLYVMHNPKFSVFVDDDGVGRDRIDLIEQTNPRPWALDWNDHVPANFKLAMDGYFYIAIGDKGLFNCVGRDGKRIDMRGGGIVRMRPGGTGLEIYCIGVRNILDIAINDDDELFTYDNTDEHDWMGRFTHMVDGGFYGYPYDFVPRRKYTLWMLEDFGGGAATGTICYTEDALPAEYRGDMFLADFGKRQIMRVVVKREGATYRVVSKTDFFTDVPADFRPVGICLAPDGKSIYICDWQHADTKENVTVGRLHRLTYTGKTSEAAKPHWFLAAAMGKTFQATVGELISALSYPSRQVRMVAQRRLAERGAEAIQPLMVFLKDGTPPSRAKMHAIWALDAIDQGQVAREAIVATMDSQDASLRRQAIRQLARTGKIHESILAACHDRDASVRFAAASALGRISDLAALSFLETLVRDSDPVVRFAAFTAMNRIGRQQPNAWEHLVDLLKSEDDSLRQGMLFTLRETYDAKLVRELTNLASDPKATAKARTLAMQLLSELCYSYPQWKGEWWAYHPALSPRPEKSAEWSETKVVIQLLRDLLNDPQPAIRGAAIVGIAKAKDVQSAPQLRKLFAAELDPATQCSLLDALGKLKDQEASALIIGVLERDESRPEVLLSAIEAAGEIGLSEFAQPLAGHLNDRNLDSAIAVLNALSKLSGDTATQAIARSLEDTRPEMRAAAVRLLGDRRAAAAVPDLLKIVDDPQLGPAVLNSLARIPDARALHAYLKALQSKDATLREQTRNAIAKIAEQVLPQLELRANQLPPQVIAELQKALSKNEKARKGPIFTIAVKVLEPAEYEAFARKATGDATRGQKLFEDADGLGCIRCHSVAGKGGSIGPDLSTIGAQFARELLVESIVYPSRSIREGYQVFTVKTKRGDWYDGLFKGETDAAVMLLDSAGTLHKISKSDIVSRRASAISLMPEGLQSALSLEEFTDLIAYLQSLKSGHAAPAAGRN
ncbi:MAG TPA: HEAT repeat domain-containing protein [Tepidisphaeraceae bacterium]|nr:HEAT repeat domain-containing protein [Tepidisphaeraceae bacterium]